MIAHSTSRRSARVAQQVEATVYMNITAPIMKCVARKDFIIGNACIAKGETFFAVKSVRREHRYYIVHLHAVRKIWECSCGQKWCNHDHTTDARRYAIEHGIDMESRFVEPQAVEVKAEVTEPQNSVEVVESAPIPTKMVPVTTETAIESVSKKCSCENMLSGLSGQLDRPF